MKGSRFVSGGGFDPRESLEALRRAETLSHTRDLESDPWNRWLPVVVGGYVGLMVARFALPLWPGIVPWILMPVAGGAFVVRLQERRGLMGLPKNAPGPMHSEAKLFALFEVVFVVAMFGLWRASNWWITADVAGLGAALGTWIFSARYAAARRSETEAGIVPGAS